MLEMDKTEFRNHLEWLVDGLAKDSEHYIEARPRFAHGVLCYANDEEGELLKASLIKQLDISIAEHRSQSRSYVESEVPNPIDSGVQLSSPDLAKSESEPLNKHNDLPYLPLSKFVEKPSSPTVIRPPEEPINTQELTMIRTVENTEYTPTVRTEYISPSSYKTTTTTERSGYSTLRSTNSYSTDQYDSSFIIPQMQGTHYERPQITHKAYRSHVDELSFPSSDKGRSIRQETNVGNMDTYRRTLSPTSRCSSSTFTTMSSSIPPNHHQYTEDDAIEKAVKILQDSCEMLDETAERIAQQRRLNQTPEIRQYSTQYRSTFQFPSELRSTNY